MEWGGGPLWSPVGRSGVTQSKLNGGPHRFTSYLSKIGASTFGSGRPLREIGTLLQSFNLTPASGLVLGILADSEQPLPPNEIADRLIVSRATVTALLDLLERQAYIRRLPHPSDRRMILVEITEKGRKTANDFRPIVHQHQLINALHRLQESLQEFNRANFSQVTYRLSCSSSFVRILEQVTHCCYNNLSTVRMKRDELMLLYNFIRYCISEFLLVIYKLIIKGYQSFSHQ